MTDTAMRSSAHAFRDGVGYGLEDVTNPYIEESMLLAVTRAGRLRLQRAQNGSSVTTTVSVGSRIVATRLD